MTAELERVTAELSQLRYQIGHEGDLLGETTTALRLCRNQIDATHCPSCAAAASVADVILAQVEPDKEPP